jgi:SPOR domain
VRATPRRALLLLAALLVPLPAGAAADVPAQSLIVERPESDVLLLALKLDQSILAETLPSYQDRERILVPFGEICRLLGLAIKVDVTRGLASGFFISEGRQFHLDVVARRVVVEGKEKRFDPAGIEVHEDDIYVDAALLSEWLPLRLDVDLYASLITVRPGETLPLQIRFERERKLAKWQARQPSALSRYPKIELPYKLIDGPFVDQTLRLTRLPDTGAGDLGGRNGVQYSTYATGDLLFAQAGAFVAGTEDGLTDARVSLSRRDPDGHLLGGLGAREVTLGEVLYPGLDLIALPSSGPGLLVSNYPLQLPSQFDRQSFRGDLPPGWEVELYRGNELLAFAQSRPDGLFEFLDVPLLFGLNVFRLELYGPQGQRRTETRLLNVGETLTPEGKVYFRLAGNDPGARLAGVTPTGSKPRSSLEVSAGLAKNLSASASVASVDLADGRHTYGEAGLRGFWGFLFANLDAAKDASGGSVLRGLLQSRVGGVGLQLEHAELDRFESERFLSVSGLLRRRTALRLDTAVPETFLPRIPVLVEVRRDQYASGQSVDLITGRLSAFRRGLFVANQVTWSLFSGGPSPQPSLGSGQLLISRFLGTFALRGEVDYDVEPRWELTNAALTAELRRVKGYLLSAGISRVIGTGQTRFLAGVSRLAGPFGYGVTADYTTSQGFGLNVLLSAGIGRDPRDGAWHTQARALAGTGGVSARAFMDSNGDGVMDDGEAGIPGVGFLLNGGGNLARTDGSGEAFIPNLATRQDLAVALATSTLEDPFSKPSRDGVRFVPRPGKVAVVDFPVVVSGEITGTVYLRQDGKSREKSGVELELVDGHGAVVRTVRSEYDGFYDVTDIRPGRYTLRVASDQLQGLRFAGGVPARRLEMAPSGTVLDGIDFILDEAPSRRAPTLAVAELPRPSPPATAPRPAVPQPAPSSAAVPGGPRVPVFAAPGWKEAHPIYAVQLASYRERAKAERDARSFAARLHRKTHVLAADLGAKGVWYRVLAGELRSDEEVLAFRLDLIRTGLWEVGPAYKVESQR